MNRLTALLLYYVMVMSVLANDYAACMPKMTCFQLTPYTDRADLVFDCASTSPPSQPAKANVYFMHGNDGPRSKGMWALMMEAFSSHGYNCLACDQRGFSPGASPNSSKEYNYDFLAQDIFAIADSHFGAGGKFHVVAHDQGGRVGWHALRPSGSGRDRFVSYAALAEAHSDAFSDALYGKNAYSKQQKVFQYLRDFTLPNPAFIYDGAIFKNVCQHYYHYTNQTLCQTAIWWYAGAVESGNLAVAPFTGDLATFGPVGRAIGIPVSFVQKHTPYPLEGLPQTTRVGFVPKVPILYMCGIGELVDKCDAHMRDASAKLVENFAYAKIVGCSHDLTTPKMCPKYKEVIDTILRHIEAAQVDCVKIVTSVYRKVLCRDPEPDGLGDWVHQCKSGMSAQDMEAILKGGAEYRDCTVCQNKCNDIVVVHGR